MTTISYATQEDMDDAFEEQMELMTRENDLLKEIGNQEMTIEQCEVDLKEAKEDLDNLRKELDDVREHIIR